MIEARELYDGWMGWVGYDLLARLLGYGPRYYRQAAMSIPVEPGMTVYNPSRQAALVIPVKTGIQSDGRLCVGRVGVTDI